MSQTDRIASTLGRSVFAEGLRAARPAQAGLSQAERAQVDRVSPTRHPSRCCWHVLILLTLSSLCFASGVARAADDDEDAKEKTAEASSDTLRVEFADGRPTAEIPILREDGAQFLGLDDLGRISGNGFYWDPESYRATLRVDSTRVGFVLGAPFVSIGTKVLQLSEPMDYHDGRLFLPYSIVEDVFCPILGDRCSFDRKKHRLRIGGQAPWIENIEVETSNKRLLLRVEPAPTGPHRLRWDPAGHLTVQVQGLTIGPEGFESKIRVSGIEGSSVRPTANGLDVELDLASSWVGVRARESEDGLAIELTQLLEDVQKKGYSLLSSYLPTATVSDSWGTRIVLEVSEPRSGSNYLQELASQIATVLEDEYRYQVVFIPDRKIAGRSRNEKGVPELPAVPPADCWIGLRLEEYDSEDARDFLLVYTGNVERMEAVAGASSRPGTPLASTGGEQVLAPPRTNGKSGVGAQRMVPWGQASRVYVGESERLAGELSDRLQQTLQFRPVRMLSRPARIFRGLSMPAVLIYPAVRADRQGLRALSDREQVDNVAKGIAEGIRDFLLTRGAR